MVQTLDSNTLRSRLSEVIDSTGKTDTVITRYHKPKAVIIPYEDYIALQEQLQDLRDGREAEAVMEAIKADPSRARPFREVVAEMIAAGELDPSILPPAP